MAPEITSYGRIQKLLALYRLGRLRSLSFTNPPMYSVFAFVYVEIFGHAGHGNGQPTRNLGMLSKRVLSSCPVCSIREHPHLLPQMER